MEEDLFVEVVKGFEHVPRRQALRIAPDQLSLTIQLEGLGSFDSTAWVSADTHVHFLSPETARLEAEAEGVNVVHLLATQWANTFTNVGDFTGASSGSSNARTMIWVGSENRHHLLGHLSLLGTRSLVSPLSTGGPNESGLGDPSSMGIVDWARAGRAANGLVVAPHFPYPHSEVIAAVALDLIDAVEIRDFWPGIDTLAFASGIAC